MSDTSTATTITVNTVGECEYRMPCGWCKLRNQQCSYIQYIPAVSPLPYRVEPNWMYRDITCTGATKQNED